MLTQYGWSAELQDQFKPYAAEGLAPGRIVVTQRGGYRLITEHGEVDARASGTLLKSSTEAERPTTGDWVAIEPRPGEGAALVRAVLARKTAFIRKASGTRGGAQVVAANVDTAFLVASMNSDLNLRRLERYLATAYESGADPVVVLTKADLVQDVAAIVAEVETIAFGAPVLAVSSKTGQGLEAIAAHLPPARTGRAQQHGGAGRGEGGGDRLPALSGLRRDGPHRRLRQG